ncbi:MAG: DnaA/Hda family protein [Chlamydiae bacterium]|nr:DnaA/Hda family protein [Chlamydiota bacterium]
MQAWQKFLTALESDLGADTVQKWLRPLKVIHFDAGNLYLEAVDSFQITWFEEHIRAKARKHLVNNNFNPIKIHISSASLEDQSNELAALDETKNIRPLKPHFRFVVDTLDPSARLEDFIVSETSKMVFEIIASLSGIRQNSTFPVELGQFNPIYMYGPSGSGKSHLLMALTTALQKNGVSARYVKMETFTENVVAAIRSGNMQDFRKSYRLVDVLLVDDVHILSKKTATQEEFFHTFNTLHTIGKQIILSAHSAPMFLQDIEPRLISRFEWGITLPLGILNREELKAMIEKRLILLGFPLSIRSIDFLLDTFSSHLKSLHKAIDALVLRAHSSKIKTKSTALQEKDIRDILHDLIAQTQRNVLNPQKIVQILAECYGIKSEDVLGKSQSHECTLPRQIAMFICRNKIKMPFTHIGQFFRRDHSTVISSVNLIKEKKESNDQELLTILRQISKKIEALADGI